MARIDRKPFAADKPGRDTHRHHVLERPPQCITVRRSSQSEFCNTFTLIADVRGPYDLAALISQSLGGRLQLGLPLPGGHSLRLAAKPALALRDVDYRGIVISAAGHVVDTVQVHRPQRARSSVAALTAGRAFQKLG